MYLIRTSLLLILLSSPTGHVHEDCAKTRCEETRQNIAKIESKMRRGYTRAQGEKMAAELRRLRAIRSKVCR
ncbi:MAG: hypothetical protein ACE5OQ_12785 [Woeseia sp.]